AAITEIGRVVDDSQVRIARFKLTENLRRMIFAAVVDHDDFVIVSQLAQRAVGQHDHAGNRAGVVIGREECADAWPLAHCVCSALLSRRAQVAAATLCALADSALMKAVILAAARRAEQAGQAARLASSARWPRELRPAQSSSSSRDAGTPSLYHRLRDESTGCTAAR